jgi:hypothetical protein
VYRNLVRHGADDPELARLRGIHRHDWYRNQVLFAAAAQLIETLRSAGVPTLVLKGAPLAVAHYDDAGSRPMGDVDVLVPPEQAATAVAVLEEAGWWPDPQAAPDMLAVRHAWSFRDEAEGHVDLHWRAFAYSCAEERHLWDAAVPLTLAGTHTHTLCAADQLLLVCVHGLGSNPVSPVRWVPDAIALIPTTDWDRFCRMAVRHRSAYTAAAALAYLRATFAPEIPEPVLARLRATPTARGERRLHHAMVGRPHHVRRAMLIHRAAYRALASAPAQGARRVSFLSFLLQRWEVDRLGAVPRFAAHKLADRYRARRRWRAALAIRA